MKKKTNLSTKKKDHHNVHSVHTQKKSWNQRKLCTFEMFVGTFLVNKLSRLQYKNIKKTYQPAIHAEPIPCYRPQTQFILLFLFIYADRKFET